MTKPEKEVEVELRDMGCPYEPLDPRTDAWLKGYGAGLESGKRIAMKAMDDTFAEMRQ